MDTTRIICMTLEMRLGSLALQTREIANMEVNRQAANLTESLLGVSKAIEKLNFEKVDSATTRLERELRGFRSSPNSPSIEKSGGRPDRHPASDRALIDFSQFLLSATTHARATATIARERAEAMRSPMSGESSLGGLDDFSMVTAGLWLYAEPFLIDAGLIAAGGLHRVVDKELRELYQHLLLSVEKCQSLLEEIDTAVRGREYQPPFFHQTLLLLQKQNEELLDQIRKQSPDSAA